MFSAESLTAPHPGFPELFQTGETYHGQPLVDHQHPHNVFSELSFYYTRPIRVPAKVPIKGKISWEFYGAVVGEPALGPVAYMHRASAAELPMAPLSHHLQDSTHTSFGVITTGLVVDRLKIEGSVFNGREPDEKRYSIQFAQLDSWSARLSVAPSRDWTAQYSYGRLERPEALEPGSQRRQTASVEYVRPFARGSWATSVVWGRVHKELENRNLNSYLLEATANFKSRNYAFSRMELVDKDELFPGNPLLPPFRIGAYTFGGAHDLIQSRLWQLALGADLTFYSKVSTLDSSYGKNPVSFQVFLRVRPALNHHDH
jgi:outer membrane receptor protein involved in Fe transport